MTALELPRDKTDSVVTTLFCDSEVRVLPFHRRKIGIRYYALRLAQAVNGVAYANADKPDQHISLITMVEKDAETGEIVRTSNSGFFDCQHV